jgi:hypothetical protein
MSMGFPVNPAVGDVHTFTDDTGRKINFQWDGICWNRMDDPSASPAPSRLRLQRIGSQPVGGGEAWNWTVYGIAVTNYPPVGQAPTREAAQAAFKAAWATCQPRERGA